VEHLGGGDAHPVEVDQVDVGPEAGSQHATVVQAHGGRRRRGLLLHDPLHAQALVLGGLPGPVLQQVRAEAGVADHRAVGAGIAEARHAAGVHEHLAHRGHVALHEVHDRDVDDPGAAVLQQHVVGPREVHRLVGALHVPGRRAEGERRCHALEQVRAGGRQLVEDPRLHLRAPELGDELVEREALQLLVGRRHEQGMDGALEAEQEPDGPSGDLAAHLDAVTVGRVDEGEEVAVGVDGLARTLQGGDRHRPAGGLGHRAEQRELTVEVVEVGHGLEHAHADGADGAGDAQQLVGAGGEARGHAAVGGLVGDGARGREPEGAGLDALGGEAAHPVDLVPGRHGGVVRAAVAHHVAAQRAVRHLGGDVDGLGSAVQGVEVLGEGLPVPGDALVERGAGDVLDPLHQGDQPLVTVGTHRGEAHSAVAHHDGRDTVPGGGAEGRVPAGLAVVVGVDVDPARGHDEPLGVELAPSGAGDLADGGDAALVDGDVGSSAGRARAVDHRAVADHQIVLGHVPLLVAPLRRPTVPGRGRDRRPGQSGRSVVEKSPTTRSIIDRNWAMSSSFQPRKAWAVMRSAPSRKRS
jgi:hypothetical protein